MNIFSQLLVFIIFSISSTALAVIIDPETYIQENGYSSSKIGDDGKTNLYSFTEQAEPSRIVEFETSIEELPKNPDVFKICDFMRGGVKAKLIKQWNIAIDVTVINYGYSGSTIACALKYMYQDKVGTQLIYSKKGAKGLYTVFITDSP